jgi:DNA (cytosine-5)-methyltransferase 1
MSSEKSIKEYSKNKKQEILQMLSKIDANKRSKPIVIEENIKVLDLFCGCGGMTKGLEDAGLEVVAGIDVWDKAIANYKKNFSHLGLCKDLTSYSPQDFEKETSIKYVDMIVGGPPCQGFSIGGKRDPNDPRNSLFIEYVKYLNHFKPKVFIMENVIGILSMKTDNKEQVIDIIIQELSQNYDCKIYKLYASDFEVPQNRRRVIIIGFRKDLNIKYEEIELVIKNPDDRVPVKTVLQNKEDVDKSYFLSERALEGIRKKKQKSKETNKGFGAQFLNINKPSYTIPARYWKDGYDALVKYSEDDVRRLTILELKRIQSFPDNYVLEGSKKDVIMQIGNAVACKLAFHLGKYISKYI